MATNNDYTDVIENFFGVYMLYCINPKYKGRIYIGYTVDPNRRIKQHNKGSRYGGAYKTSNKGPWEMILITHGFPNDIAALRFEWAWQHPLRSRRLRSVGRKKAKESSLNYHLRILSNMLNTNPWSRLPLTLRWLKPEYQQEFELGMEPPLHMPVAYGLVKTAKAPTVTQETEEVICLRDCLLCHQELEKQDEIKCIFKECSMRAHIICLAKHFLKNEHPDQLLPVEGKCPGCCLQMLWGDLIRSFKGCSSSNDNPMNEKHSSRRQLAY